MNTSKFQCLLSCKGSQAFSQSFFVAEDQKQADAKGAELAKNFKTTDARLKEYIKENGGVVSTVTEVK